MVFCNQTNKNNNPTIGFIQTMNSILGSESFKSSYKIKTFELVLFLAPWTLKVYVYFLRIYIDSEFFKLIKFVNSFDELNEAFYLDLNESYLSLKKKGNN